MAKELVQMKMYKETNREALRAHQASSLGECESP